jgi:peptide-methionine (R)-S-oxide reductase
MMRTTRRQILAATAALTGSTTAMATETFEVMHTEEEWRESLTAEQFRVLREAATERAGASPLNDEKRGGTFICVACDLPLYSSETKFESGTGWPSFWQPLDHAIETSKDRFLFMVRTEVHCRRCGGHLGHVFEDGPQPTGLRYCMNGVAMQFEPMDSKDR